MCTKKGTEICVTLMTYLSINKDLMILKLATYANMCHILSKNSIQAMAQLLRNIKFVQHLFQCCYPSHNIKSINNSVIIAKTVPIDSGYFYGCDANKSRFAAHLSCGSFGLRGRHEIAHSSSFGIFVCPGIILKTMVRRRLWNHICRQKEYASHLC